MERLSSKEVFRAKLTEENLPFIAGLMVSRGLTVTRLSSVYQSDEFNGLSWMFRGSNGVSHMEEADVGDEIVMRSGIQYTQNKFYAIKKEA